MTEDEILSIRHKIRARVDATNEHIAALQFSIQQLPPIEEMDRAARTETLNYKRKCEADIRNSMKKIAHLDVALKRVGEPDFGICIECDKPIETTKLMLMPETMYCVRCHKM